MPRDGARHSNRDRGRSSEVRLLPGPKRPVLGRFEGLEKRDLTQRELLNVAREAVIGLAFISDAGYAGLARGSRHIAGEIGLRHALQNDAPVLAKCGGDLEQPVLRVRDRKAKKPVVMRGLPSAA